MRDQEETGVDEAAAEDAETGESDTTDENTDDAADEDNSSSESGAADGEAAEEGDEGEEDDKVDEDEEPPSRKPRTAADFVAMRRGKKLERQKQKSQAEQGEDDEGDDEDADINEEDEKVIAKAIDARLKPFEEQQQLQVVKSEIDEFVAKNPDFKPFTAKALKWSQHPTYKNVPTEQLMFAVAGGNLMKMGAKRSQAADKKAAATKTGSGTGGNAKGGSKPVWDMTDEEFEAEHQKVMLGQ